MIGIKHMDEKILYQKYHFYFNGLKFVTIKLEILKKLPRKNIKDYGDLIQIERKINFNIKLPKIPKEYTKEQFIKLVKKYIEKTYPDNKDYMDKL